MADDLALSRLSAFFESLSSLDQLDPPSPVITIVDEEYIPIVPHGISLAEELESSGVIDLFDDSEDEESQVASPCPEDGVPNHLQSAADPVYSPEIGNEARDGAANNTSTLSFEDAAGAERLHAQLNPFFVKDNIKYYCDMRSLHPVGAHVEFFQQQFHLFRDLKFDDPPMQVPRATILEVGCGAGLWAKAFAYANPGIRVLGIDSTCFGPRTDEDPLNYQFATLDIVNTTASFSASIEIPEISGRYIGGQFEYIRCTRLNGRVSRWSDWFRKAFFYAKNGAYIEVFDVLPDHVSQIQARQPTWAMVPELYSLCAQMRHRPHLHSRELAGFTRIEQLLEAAGFTGVKTAKRIIELRRDDKYASYHIESLACQAVCVAHVIGFPIDKLGPLYNLLVQEANEFGLCVKSFTVSAQKLE